MPLIEKIINLAIPNPSLEKGGGMLSESRIFLISAFATIPLTIIFTMSYFLGGYTEVALSCTLGLCISILSLLVFAKYRNPTLSINILIASGFSILVVGSFWAGGIHAPGLLWFANVQILAVLMLNRKSALFWIGIFGLGAIALAYPALLGMTATNTLSPADFDLYTLLGTLGSAVLMMIITMSSRAQHERMQRDILTKNTLLTESSGQNTSLVRMLSHDIANSLAIIELSADMMVKGKNSEKNNARLMRAIENAKDLISHVRDQQAILSGKKSPEISEANLVFLIDQSVDLMKEKLQKKDITVSVHYDKDEKHIALVEMVSATNVIFCNILSNAIKFSPDGGSIMIRIRSLDEQVQVEIEDNGVGIPSDILKGLYNFSTSTTRTGTAGEKGTGFGMPLVKTYVESFGGSIQVLSKSKSEHPDKHGTQVILSFRKPQLAPESTPEAALTNGTKGTKSA